MKSLIQKYSSKWIEDFAKIKREIDSGLIGLEYEIEHIGSTSVPGLDAKPIIDIDIIYQEEPTFENIKLSLIKIGYYHNGDQGIPEREVFKRGGIIKNENLDSITHHLYVCLKDSEGLERHLLSRNFLRKNEWARKKYQDMKYEIAAEANQNKKKYAALKELTVNDFIDEIIALERKTK